MLGQVLIGVSSALKKLSEENQRERLSRIIGLFHSISHTKPISRKPVWIWQLLESPCASLFYLLFRTLTLSACQKSEVKIFIIKGETEMNSQ